MDTRADRSLLTPQLPFNINVELTSVCNQRCTMCPLTAGTTLSGRHRGHMPHPVWERVLEAVLLVRQVMWIGYGETLLHPRALEYLAAVDAAGVFSSMTTNGTQLRPATCAALARLGHMVHLNVSIDSLDPDVYRGIRKTSPAKVLAGLRNLVQVFDTRRITVGAVIMRENIDTLAALPPYLASLGIGKLQINALNEEKGRHFAGELSADGRHAAALAAIRRAGEDHGVKVVIDVARRLDANVGDAAAYDAGYRDAPGEGRTRRCLLPWEFPFVDKDGRVFLCSNATGREAEVMGSLLDEDFATLWHGPAYREVRARFLQHRPLPESCARCTVQENGVHPLHEYRAEVLEGAGARGVRVRNTGSAAWEPDAVRVATARPRDRTSSYESPEWMSANRVSSNPVRVRPGETVTFRMPMHPGTAREHFQLVADGRHWLANTGFSVGEEALADSRPHEGLHELALEQQEGDE